MSGKFHLTVTERLRAANCNSAHDLMCEAADEIDRLASRLDNALAWYKLAAEQRDALVGRLDAVRKYCEEQIAGNSDYNEWVKGFKDGLGAVLEQFVVERGSSIDCSCYECLKDKKTADGWPITATRMIVCATCGNKRCPHATDHRNACTDNNEPGQLGSRYERAPPRCDNIPCARDAGHDGECSSFRALGE